MPSYTRSQTVTFPENLRGDFFVYVLTDAGDQVVEPDGEDNNASSLASIQLTIPHSDLIVEAVGGPEVAQSGDSVEVLWRVRNQGPSVTNRSDWTDVILLSSDGVLDAGDTELGRFSRSSALEASESYTKQATVVLPEGIEGDYHLFVVADETDRVFEDTFEDNNVTRSLTPVSITRRPDPDLQVSALATPASALPGQTISVDWTISNTGHGAGPCTVARQPLPFYRRKSRGSYLPRFATACGGSFVTSAVHHLSERDASRPG